MSTLCKYVEDFNKLTHRTCFKAEVVQELAAVFCGRVRLFFKVDFVTLSELEHHRHCGVSLHIYSNYELVDAGLN